MAAVGGPSEPSLPPTRSGALLGPVPWRVGLLVTTMICAVVLVSSIFTAAHQVFGWAVAASVIALLLTPVVAWMDQHMPRPLAIILTFMTVAALAVGITWLYSSSMLDQVDQLQESGPSIAAEIENREDRLGAIAREISLVDQVTELTARFDERTGSGADALRSAALSAPPYFVSMVLTIFLLLFGRRMVQGGLNQLSRERRDRLAPALADGTRRTQVYVWASIAQGLVSGAAIWVVGSMLEIPAIGLLALFGALAATVPYFGIVIGWLPVLLLAVGVASGLEVALAALVAASLQVTEALWWRRQVDDRSIRVGPAVPIVVAILGFGIYGIGGALYGCVLAVLALAMADQLRPGEAIPTPLDEPPADPER